MSEDTPSLPYTDEEYADMLQCYLISGKNLELAQMCYTNKYSKRRQPNLHTLKIVVQKYLDSLVSNNTANPGVNFTVSSKKDESILDYFTENSHATVEKAASIFCVQTSYIDQLLKKRKAHTVLKGQEDEATGVQKRSVKVLSKKAATKIKQEKSDSEEELVIKKNQSDFNENNIETVIIIEKSECNEIFCREDIISETHDTDIYREASTSYMIDNYLGESTNNETQDVGNYRETAKSETGDEFMCREIEYTKKRNKRYSKRSGTKKPKSSEDIISKTPVAAAYSEATTSTTTDNLLGEITTNELQDVGNYSETAKSETDDEVTFREIDYTKKRKKKYSKRSGTENPNSSKDIMSETQDVAVYSEATTITTTDNLLREVNINESQDVGNRSQTAKSKTDDEVLCREIEYTKKRDKKYSKRSGSKKPKSSEDIISKTPGVAVYSEATTSTATDNLLRDITMNESQDVGNCSQTAKSDTDDEVICREIEYTKKCNKKYLKRSGTKKPKSSEDIMRETPDDAVYSVATTRTTTDNLLREVNINESQDVGNCSQAAKSETDDEFICREIEYTKKRNKKYSKRSGTKKPKSSEDIISKTPVVAVNSEATTSRATDNLLREITMNESQDVGNCSKTAKTVTDDEVICREIEYTKKPNKKYSKSSGTKNPNSSKDIMSETQDVAVYSEATTGTTTDNLLREVNIIESQDVENCSQTAKSQTDDEVLCREIEYTKKRNKKYSKRNGTKKSKSSQDIMRETPDDAVYSEATTSTTTDNLLREITTNELQDFGNYSETAKSETDDEVIFREIDYTKKRKKKYSKRSGTKKPKASKENINKTQDGAVYSEATTSKATDNNLLGEITMNESQDVGNNSETRKSETENDVTCCEMEYTKKRKKKYLKSSGSKKPKKNKKRKQKSSSQEPKTLEFSRMLNAIVYTTKLEEMAILHKKIKHLDNAIIINDILRESKPKYNYWEHKSNKNVKRTMSFKLLKKILKKLKKNLEVVDLTDNVADDDLIITDVIYPSNIVTLNAEDTKGKSNKSDVVIVINNLFSNLRDIYVTDWKCDLIEYRCTKLNDKCDIYKFDKPKIRLILDACCWIKRHRKVESIWPRNECKFFRFLITIHKCPLDQCNCCCKPNESTTDVTLYKPSDINVFTNDSNAKSCDKNKNLILNALKYKKPDTNKNIKTNFNLQNVDIMRNLVYLLKNISKVGHCSFSRSECFEIGSNQDIVRFHTENYFRDPRQKCYQCFDIITAKHRSVLEFVVCCKWKLISVLNEQYKAGKISANTLKFLKGMVSRNQNVCNCCKHLLSECDSRPKTNQISNLIVNIPKVEHTRKLVKPTLLKIGFMDKTSSRTFNNLNKVAQQILQETKYYPHKNSAIQTTKIPSTVKLKVTCNQIPGLDFELDNVNNQLATMIMAKFSNMKFTVKEDLKVVASLNNPIQTTSTEEYKIIARILLHTQKCLKLVPLPPESDIGLVAKIVIPSDLENNNNRDSFFDPFKNVNKGTVTVGDCNSNVIVKPTELAILKVLQAFTPFNITKPTTKNLFQGRSNTDFIKNEKFGADDSTEVTYDSCSSQNYAHKLKNKEQPSKKTSRRKNKTTYFDEVEKTKERGENSSENKIQVHDVVCLNFSSYHFGSDISDINYDEAYTSKLKPYDGLANVMRCSKKCYSESFKSFLNKQKKHFDTEALEVEKNIVLPKISSVFSLQSSAQQTQKETNEPVPSTSKADNASNNVNTETTVPTTSNNENPNVNSLNAATQFIAGTQLMLYDPVKKNTQVVCLTPNGLLVPVANSLNTINPLIVENILSREPVTIPENNSNVAVLTPIIVNQIYDGNMTFIPAMQPIEENSILPDIINDIPKYIDLRGGENNAIFVKQETKDDVVVLDSD